MKVLAILYNGGKAAEEQSRLLGTVENKIGSTNRAMNLLVSSDKEGENSDFQKHIVDAEVLITTPFHPGYLTRDLIQKAKNLKICITAGVGSDHIDLDAAVDHNIQVLEVSGSNVTSVAEHVVMSILLLVRNFVPAHEMIERGDWQVSDIARNAFDLEGKVVGTIGAGRIGYRVLQRVQPFDCKELLYYDYAPLPAAAAQAINARRVENLEEFVSQCDVVAVNCPLHDGTRNLVNADLLKHFKKGAWLVNTARGAICDKDAVAEALKSGHLAGYAGDVWNVQPAPKDHVWRTMKNPLGGGNGMVPHYSGTTLDAQARTTPITINNFKYQSPNWCEDVGNSNVYGHWIVRNEQKCASYWAYFKDKGCTSPGSGIRRFEAPIAGVTPGQDAGRLCYTTPATILGQTFEHPMACPYWGNHGFWGVWDVRDGRCK